MRCLFHKIPVEEAVVRWPVPQTCHLLPSSRPGRGSVVVLLGHVSPLEERPVMEAGDFAVRDLRWVGCAVDRAYARIRDWSQSDSTTPPSGLGRSSSGTRLELEEGLGGVRTAGGGGGSSGGGGAIGGQWGGRDLLSKQGAMRGGHGSRQGL